MRGAIGLVQASGLNIGTAVEAAPAWMIITAPASLKTGDIGIVIRDYKTMESCEAVSKYIHSLRGVSYNESNWDAQGIWRSNRAVSSRKSLLLLLYECPTPVSLTIIENILKSLIETAYE